MPNVSAININGGYCSLSNLKLDTTINSKITIEFWMYWNGTYNVMPFGFNNYDLYFYNESFGFNTGNSDLYGISAHGLENKWIHIAAIFNNGDVTQNKIYINGEQQNLSFRSGSSVSRIVSSNAQISGWPTNASYYFRGMIDEFRIWNIERSKSDIIKNYKKIIRLQNEGGLDDVSKLVAYYRFDENNGTTAKDLISGSIISLNNIIWTTNVPDVSGYFIPPIISFKDPLSSIPKNTEYILDTTISAPSPNYVENTIQMMNLGIENDRKTFSYLIDKDNWKNIVSLNIW